MADPVQIRRWLLISGLCLGGFALGFLLLPVLLPFLLGALIALCVEKPVLLLTGRTRLPRWICSGLCVSTLLLLLGSAVFLLCRRLLFELGSFAAELPVLLESFSGLTQQLEKLLQAFAQRAPDGLGIALEGWVTELFAGSSGLAARLTDLLISAAGSALAALPDLLLFALTAVVSAFLISAELPQLREAAKRRLPKRWQRQSREAAQRLLHALGGWFRAQLTLMGITFVLVTAGLFFLRRDFALLFGALTALVDALPLLGAGTILLPWGLLMFLRGEARCGVGLMLLYGVAALTRSALEPKLLGRHLGINPLLTLFALYAGYRLLGVLGMLLFPVAVLLAQQLIGAARPPQER